MSSPKQFSLGTSIKNLIFMLGIPPDFFSYYLAIGTFPQLIDK
jgi:hypothetical protein